MGNSLSFWEPHSPQQDIDAFLTSLPAPSLKDSPTNILFIWQFASSDDTSVHNNAVNMSLSPLYEVTSSYVVLHVFSDSPKGKIESDKDLDVLSASLRPSIDCLTPRGLKVPISFRTRSYLEKDYISHDTYVWNGKKAIPIVKATAVAKAYQLERSLRQFDLRLILSSAPTLPRGFTPNFAENCKEDPSLRPSAHHLIKTLSLYLNTGRFSDESADFSELFGERKADEFHMHKSASEPKPKQRVAPSSSSSNYRVPTLGSQIPASAKVSALSSRLALPSSVATKAPALGPSKLGLNMAKVEETTPAVSDRNPDGGNRDLVRASTVEYQGVVERGTEREEEIPRSTRDRVRYFNKICSKVTEDLFLGSDYIARDLTTLQENGITHVLNCAGTVCNDYYPGILKYKTLHLLDGKQEDVVCVFLDVMSFLHAALEDKGKVFIHCQQGISRSSTMLICYLMFSWKQPYQKVHEVVKKLRDISSPNAGFVCQLLAWQKKLNTPPSDRPKELFVVLPHNLCAPDVYPLKQVPCDVKSLDPRCVFVLTTPAAIFLWKGKDSDHPVCEANARLYIQRMQFFLGCTQNVVEVSEGNESAEFMDALNVPNKEQWNKEIDALLTPEGVIAVLDTSDKVPVAHLWLGHNYDEHDDQEVNNLGLQFLTRNDIFMTTCDYKILVSREGKENPNFRGVLSASLAK